MSTPYTLGLLQYNYTDNNNIVTYSTENDKDAKLLTYLSSNSIPLVSFIPDSVGVYCINEDNYKIYQVYLDSESNLYNQVYQYSLQWISVVGRYADIKSTFQLSFGANITGLDQYLLYNSGPLSESCLVSDCKTHAKLPAFKTLVSMSYMTNSPNTSFTFNICKNQVVIKSFTTPISNEKCGYTNDVKCDFDAGDDIEVKISDAVTANTNVILFFI